RAACQRPRHLAPAGLQAGGDRHASGHHHGDPVGHFGGRADRRADASEPARLARSGCHRRLVRARWQAADLRRQRRHPQGQDHFGSRRCAEPARHRGADHPAPPHRLCRVDDRRADGDGSRSQRAQRAGGHGAVALCRRPPREELPPHDLRSSGFGLANSRCAPSARRLRPPGRPVAEWRCHERTQTFRFARADAAGPQGRRQAGDAAAARPAHRIGRTRRTRPLAGRGARGPRLERHGRRCRGLPQQPTPSGAGLFVDAGAERQRRGNRSRSRGRSGSGVGRAACRGLRTRSRPAAAASRRRGRRHHPRAGTPPQGQRNGPPRRVHAAPRRFAPSEAAPRQHGQEPQRPAIGDAGARPVPRRDPRDRDARRAGAARLTQTSRRSKKMLMTRPTPRRAIGPKLSLALTSALAGVLLAGCTTQAAPPATLSATKAEQALASGKHSQAIEHAEAAVLAEPHNAEYRSILASAYLDAGRFASAETTYKDAMQLGDQSPRNALSLALALSAQGKYPDAAALLNQWEGRIATSDLGLALALAGQPERGIHLMSNAIRSGENTAKMRQNLAYSYALAGRWREARLMAEQDVPADQVGDRIEQWAAMAAPEAWHVRIASLLDVPAHAADAGQPVQLALANTPSIDQLAAEATAF